MQPEDLILVSVDDHLIEPPDVFLRHVPAKYLDQAPRVVNENGADTWVFGNVRARSVGLNAVASWPKEEWGFDPVGFAEMRPGCYDVNERVRDMDANGVLASMSFPSMARFAGQFFLEHPDKDLALVMLQAYNDWHIDEWCAAHPGRLLPLAIGPLWDPHLLRLRYDGSRPRAAGLSVSARRPTSSGSRRSTAITGIRSSRHARRRRSSFPCTSVRDRACRPRATDTPIDIIITLPTHLAINAASDLLWGPVLRQFPTLRFALSEGGVGWVPYFLERVDRSYRNQTWTGQDFGDKLPSDLFREHILTCFIVDDVALRVRDAVGIDNIAWECDYPHSDSTWPRSPEVLVEAFKRAGITNPDEVNKITYQNALRWYGYDPFSVVPKEKATVGVLRSQAADVDTGIRSRAAFRELYRTAS